MSPSTLYVIITDINECDTDNGQCDQLCNNYPGGYNCSCNPGYTLDIDGRSCNGNTPLYYYTSIYLVVLCVLLDDQECDIDNGGCQHTCINTDGGYYCSCNQGYQIDDDHKSCKGTW